MIYFNFLHTPSGGGYQNSISFMKSLLYLNYDFSDTCVITYQNSGIHQICLENDIKFISECHKRYIYPLWSTAVLSRDYSDGTMNQPFSSVLSILAEYGVISLSLIFTSAIKLRYLIKNNFILALRQLRCIDFALTYLGILMIFDNIMEHQGIIIISLLVIISIAKNSSHKKEDPKNVIQKR
jgi:hypothetical protein